MRFPIDVILVCIRWCAACPLSYRHLEDRRANQIKVLYFDRSGWCVWAKRLEQGRLLRGWNTVSTREMDWTGLKLRIEGIEVRADQSEARRRVSPIRLI